MFSGIKIAVLPLLSLCDTGRRGRERRPCRALVTCGRAGRTDGSRELAAATSDGAVSDSEGWVLQGPEKSASPESPCLIWSVFLVLLSLRHSIVELCLQKEALCLVCSGILWVTCEAGWDLHS